MSLELFSETIVYAESLISQQIDDPILLYKSTDIGILPDPIGFLLCNKSLPYEVIFSSDETEIIETRYIEENNDGLKYVYIYKNRNSIVKIPINSDLVENENIVITNADGLKIISALTIPNLDNPLKGFIVNGQYLIGTGITIHGKRFIKIYGSEFSTALGDPNLLCVVPFDILSKGDKGGKGVKGFTGFPGEPLFIDCGLTPELLICDQVGGEFDSICNFPNYPEIPPLPEIPELDFPNINVPIINFPEVKLPDAPIPPAPVICPLDLSELESFPEDTMIDVTHFDGIFTSVFPTNEDGPENTEYTYLIACNGVVPVGGSGNGLTVPTATVAALLEDHEYVIKISNIEVLLPDLQTEIREYYIFKGFKTNTLNTLYPGAIGFNTPTAITNNVFDFYCVDDQCNPVIIYDSLYTQNASGHMFGSGRNGVKNTLAFNEANMRCFITDFRGNETVQVINFSFENEGLVQSPNVPKITLFDLTDQVKWTDKVLYVHTRKNDNAKYSILPTTGSDYISNHPLAYFGLPCCNTFQLGGPSTTNTSALGSVFMQNELTTEKTYFWPVSIKCSPYKNINLGTSIIQLYDSSESTAYGSLNVVRTAAIESVDIPADVTETLEFKASSNIFYNHSVQTTSTRGYMFCHLAVDEILNNQVTITRVHRLKAHWSLNFNDSHIYDNAIDRHIISYSHTESSNASYIISDGGGNYFGGDKAFLGKNLVPIADDYLIRCVDFVTQTNTFYTIPKTSPALRIEPDNKIYLKANVTGSNSLTTEYDNINNYEALFEKTPKRFWRYEAGGYQTANIWYSNIVGSFFPTTAAAWFIYPTQIAPVVGFTNYDRSVLSSYTNSTITIVNNTLYKPLDNPPGTIITRSGGNVSSFKVFEFNLPSASEPASAGPSSSIFLFVNDVFPVLHICQIEYRTGLIGAWDNAIEAIHGALADGTKVWVVAQNTVDKFARSVQTDLGDDLFIVGPIASGFTSSNGTYSGVVEASGVYTASPSLFQLTVSGNSILSLNHEAPIVGAYSTTIADYSYKGIYLHADSYKLKGTAYDYGTGSVNIGTAELTGLTVQDLTGHYDLDPSATVSSIGGTLKYQLSGTYTNKTFGASQFRFIPDTLVEVIGTYQEKNLSGSGAKVKFDVPMFS